MHSIVTAEKTIPLNPEEDFISRKRLGFFPFLTFFSLVNIVFKS